jgi:hypothetical protein
MNAARIIGVLALEETLHSQNECITLKKTLQNPSDQNASQSNFVKIYGNLCFCKCIDALTQYDRAMANMKQHLGTWRAKVSIRSRRLPVVLFLIGIRSRYEVPEQGL